MLLDAGADVNAPVAKGGYTPLDAGVDLRLATSWPASLIEHGAKVNAANSGGVTALMIAAAGNRSSVVALLLKSGADVNARSEDGRTALSIAQAQQQRGRHQDPGGGRAQRRSQVGLIFAKSRRGERQ